MRRTPPTLLGSLVLSLALVGCERAPTRLNGVTIDRTPATLRSHVDDVAARWLDVEVLLATDGLTERLTRRDLGARYDVERVVTDIEALDRLPWSEALALEVGGLRRGGLDLAMSPTLDAERLAWVVDAFAERIDRAPGDEPGRRLDRGVARQRIADALLGGEVVFELPVETVPRVLAPLPPPRRIEVLGTYTTHYRARGDEGPRAHNVVTAATALDGAIIPPFGTLSFNDRVGERAIDRGYRIAHVIENGEMIDGVGGGVCQVASTLHAAALLGGFTIRSHVPHSRPSTYIPLGLDATVVWPSVDLEITNPFDVPVQVEAHAGRGTMSVRLLGTTTPLRVDVSREVIARIGYEERVVEDLTVTEPTVSQEGIGGVVITRRRHVEGAGGARDERLTLRYPPTDRIVRVPAVAADAAL